MGTLLDFSTEYYANGAFLFCFLDRQALWPYFSLPASLCVTSLETIISTKIICFPFELRHFVTSFIIYHEHGTPFINYSTGKSSSFGNSSFWHSKCIYYPTKLHIFRPVSSSELNLPSLGGWTILRKNSLVDVMFYVVLLIFLCNVHLDDLHLQATEMKRCVRDCIHHISTG